MLKIRKKYIYSSNVYRISTDGIGDDFLVILQKLFDYKATLAMYIESDDLDRIHISFSEDSLGKNITISKEEAKDKPQYIVRTPEEALKIVEKIYKLNLFE